MTQEEAISILKTYLDDKHWCEEIVDLTLLGYFVHEIAFNSVDAQAEHIKDALIGILIEKLEIPGYLAGKQKDAYTVSWRVTKLCVAKHLSRGSSGLSLDELRAMIALGEKLSLVDAERTKKWIAKAWEAGRHQRLVHDMEVEGSVNNEIGIIMNFGAYLSLFGVKEGFRLQR